MTTEELAWMAAIIDLKGLQIRKKNQDRATPQCVLAVDSRHFNVIERLAKMTGTSPEAPRKQELHAAEWMRRGCAEHCPEAHIHTPGPVMPDTKRWSQTGIAAAIVLHNIMPYMSNADLWKEFQQETVAYIALTGRGSHAQRDAMKRLVGLGWALPPEISQVLLELATIAGSEGKNDGTAPAA